MMLVLKDGRQMILGPTQEVLNQLNEKRASLVKPPKPAAAAAATAATVSPGERA
jgi:hypothetical protein